MIKVNYTELDGPYGPAMRLEAAGHAGYAPAGQDIVCAGVSTLMQALVSLLAGEENAHSDAFDEPDGPRLTVTAARPCTAWVEGAFELAKAGFALSMVRVLPAAALGLLMLGLVLCFWLSWRGAKRLETVANGLEALAQGQTVQLPTDGFAGELAEKLNQTGAQLQAKNEMLSRRDNARTQWIAGVSHDVRTPLALILGWAEQLEQDALLPDSSRQKAAGIRTQCEKLRTLIDDLNLTSKLEYGAQPLRRKDLRAGPLFRQLVAQFCESPLAERCEITLEQEEPAEQTVLSVDEALLARLLENLLNNSVRHNPKPVNITVHTRRAGERFCLTVADDGIGYPAAVLAALNAAEPAENAPHILGLYVVQQIAAAHGGRAVFGQNTPHGAKAVVYLPLG